jgi:hypothetical protein
MATLAGNTIASTYPLLLKVDSNGLDGTLRAIQDGDATDSVLYLATDSALISGNGTKLYFFDADGGEHISADNAGNLTIGAGVDLNLTATTDINIPVNVGLRFGDGGENIETDNTSLTITAGTASALVLDANSKISLSNNDSGGTGGADSTSGNTLFGYLAGEDIASGGINNTLIGHGAGKNITTSDYNVALGQDSLKSIVSGGEQNTSVGALSGDALTTGDANVFMGVGAGGATEDVDNATIIGYIAGAGVMTSGADGTVAVGHSALNSLTSGSDNVAVGFEAAKGITTGASNVALGDSALATADGAEANNVAIGHRAGGSINSDTAHDNVLIGTDAGKAGAGAIAENVIIGSEAGDSSGAAAFEKGVIIGRHAGRNVGADASGSILIGFQAGNVISSGQYNIGIGYNALVSMGAGDSNVAIGYQAGEDYNPSANTGNSVFIGAQAGLNASSTVKTTFVGAGSGGSGATSGGENTALGYRSGYKLTSGTHNVFIGNETGKEILASDSNTAVGSQALITDDEGSATTAIGYASLNKQNMDSGDELSHNVGVGAYSGYYNVTGINNTYIGYEAGFGHVNQSNSGNTGVGTDALTDIKTGTNNVAVGKASGYSQEEGDFNVYIGYEAGYYNDNADTEGHNVLIGYDNGKSITTGTNNVGLGSRVMGESGSNAITGANNVCLGSLAGYNMSGTTANNSILGQGAGYNLTTGQNNLFLGHDAGTTGSPGGNFTTQSSIIALGDENNGASHIQTDWTVASDKRDKTDVKDLDLGLEFVNKLTPVTYKWDKRSKYIDKHDPTVDLNEVVTDGTHKEDWLDVGFLAQDVAEIESSYNYKIAEKTNLTTSLSEDGKQYGTIYAKFVPMLVKAVQELSAKVKALEDA